MLTKCNLSLIVDNLFVLSKHIFGFIQILSVILIQLVEKFAKDVF